MHRGWTSEYNLLMFDELGSTNDEAKRLAQSRPIGKFVLSAKKQTSGRGRYGRAWTSMSGNLFMSLLTSPELPIEIFAQSSFVAAISVHEALSSIIKDHQVSLKWPNDVLVDGAKIAGILLESIDEYLIVGIGVNVKRHPVIADRHTTSFTKLKYSDISADLVMDLIMQSFEYYYKVWMHDGFESIRHEWLLRAHKAGTVITINDGKVRLSGEFMDIDHMGSIRIKLTTGEIHTMSAGEVFFA